MTELPVYSDEAVERELIWLSMMGSEKQKKFIFRTARIEMFCGQCQLVFKVAADLFLSGAEFGLPEINSRLKDQGVDLPQHFIDPADFNFGDPKPILDRLCELWQKRELFQRIQSASYKLEKDSALTVGRYLASSVMGVIDSRSTGEDPIAENLVEEALVRYNTPNLSGYLTGIKEVDEWTRGLVPGRLYVLGGTKKTGKTRFAVAAIYGIASKNTKCSFITLEMSPGEIVDLLNAKMCYINSSKLENKELSENDRFSLAENATPLRGILNNLQLSAPGLITPDGLEAIIRFHVSLYHSRIIAIDFLTKIVVDSRYENAERGKICARLSALARELQIAVLLLVQLNKEAEAVENPHIGMVEGTGQITQFADAILILVNESRTKADLPPQIESQSMKIHITQRQGACSSWLPIYARLQVLDFSGKPQF